MSSYTNQRSHRTQKMKPTLTKGQSFVTKNTLSQPNHARAVRHPSSSCRRPISGRIASSVGHKKPDIKRESTYYLEIIIHFMIQKFYQVLAVMAVIALVIVFFTFKSKKIYYWIIINAVSFLIYVVDKVAAQSGWWRIPEKVLHALALFGGWLGAICAKQICRHKISKDKLNFQVDFLCCTAANIAYIYFNRNEIFMWN